MVSIILPVYNAEKFIYYTLESIFAQTYKDIELIIVDDCSTDNSLALIESFNKTKQWGGVIKIVKNETNLGPGKSRDIGIQESRGDYIFFIDGDDLLRKDCISTMLSYANKKDAVICSYDFINESTTLAPETYNKFSKFYPKTGLYSDEDIFKLYILGTPWGKLIRRSFIFKNHLFFSNAYRMEDTNWWSHCMLCFSNIYILNDSPMYFYRRGHESLMGRNNETEYIFQQELLNLENTLDFIRYQKEINKQFTDGFTQQRSKYSIFYKRFLEFRSNMFKRIFRYKINNQFSYYKYLRNMSPITKEERMIMNLKMYINNFHLFLPERLGFIITKCLSKF